VFRSFATNTQSTFNTPFANFNLNFSSFAAADDDDDDDDKDDDCDRVLICLTKRNPRNIKRSWYI